MRLIERFGRCACSFNTLVLACDAGEIEEGVAYPRSIKAFALFNYISGSMPLVHEVQGGIVAAFNADSKVVHAKCGKLFEVGVGFVLQVADANKAPYCLNMRKRLFHLL